MLEHLPYSTAKFLNDTHLREYVSYLGVLTMRTHCLEVDVTIDEWNIPVLGNDAVTINRKRRRVSTAVLAVDDDV